MLFLYFLVQNLEKLPSDTVIIVMCNENKQIDYISSNMSKRRGIFTENFTILFAYTLETGDVPEFEYDKF